MREVSSTVSSSASGGQAEIVWLIGFGLGVQDVGGNGCGDAKEEGGADSPADSPQLWQLHGNLLVAAEPRGSSAFLPPGWAWSRAQTYILDTPNDSRVVPRSACRESDRRVEKQKNRQPVYVEITDRNQSQVRGVPVAGVVPTAPRLPVATGCADAVPIEDLREPPRRYTPSSCAKVIAAQDRLAPPRRATPRHTAPRHGDQGQGGTAATVAGSAAGAGPARCVTDVGGRPGSLTPVPVEDRLAPPRRGTPLSRSKVIAAQDRLAPPRRATPSAGTGDMPDSRAAPSSGSTVIKVGSPIYVRLIHSGNPGLSTDLGDGLPPAATSAKAVRRDDTRGRRPGPHRPRPGGNLHPGRRQRGRPTGV